MGWVKLDDSFPRHPKVVGLSDKAFRAYVEALCYCGQYLTDGHLPAGIIPDAQVAVLVEARLLDLNGSGWVVHDYLEWGNRSRSTVEKQTNAGRNAARMRWAEVVASEVQAEALSISKSSSGSSSSEARPSSFEEFWEAYPRKVGKVKARQEFDAVTEQGADPTVIIAAAKIYAADDSRETKFTAHPSTWLHQGRWLDVVESVHDVFAEIEEFQRKAREGS